MYMHIHLHIYICISTCIYICIYSGDGRGGELKIRADVEEGVGKI